MGPLVLMRGWLARRGATLAGAVLAAALAVSGPGATPGKAQVAELMDGFINGVASVQGLHGSNWQTDVWLHNARRDYPIIFRLFYAPKGTPADEQNFVPITVNPNQTVYLEDVVKNTFGKTGSGAIYFQILPGFSDKTKFLIIESNTYNKTPDGKQFGQQVPGKFWFDPYKKWGDLEKIVGVPGRAQYLPPIQKTQYRANVNFLTDHQSTNVRVTIRSRSGYKIVDERLNVTPNTWYQWVDIVNKFGLRDWLDGMYVEFTPLEGGKAFSSMSIIDNKTNDGSHFESMDRFRIESDSFLLAAAYLQGANNSQWRSDVLTINTNMSGTTGVTFFAIPRGQENGGNLDPRGRDYYSAESIIFENILKELFEYPPGTSATLYLNQLRGTRERDVMAFMRTYTEEQNQNGERITYGQDVPAVNWKDSIKNDLEGRIVGVVHNNDFRTNLILQNTLSNDQVRTNEPANPIIEVYDMNGAKLGEKTYNLLPGEYRQVNRVIEDILGAGASVEHATLVVKLPNVNKEWRGGVMAAASVINGNVNPGTNDPRLIMAKPIDRYDPKEEAVWAYLKRWFPANNTRFYLSSPESYALINGAVNVRSYVVDLATELWNDPRVQAGIGSIEDVVAWLRARADGDPNNSEFCSRFDPIHWDNDAYGPPGFVVYDGLGCGPVIFRPGLDAILRIYDMVRNDFIFNFVKNYPELYGGQPGGVPDINFDPTWNH